MASIETLEEAIHAIAEADPGATLLLSFAEAKALREHIERLTRHISTLCALLSGVKVSRALEPQLREIVTAIKKEIGE